jgi:hypothetical protein
MMIQQTTTMNNLMMIMARNEERRQEIPIREIQQTSTPTSTITNSQFSLSQQSASANKRKIGKIDGLADDDTTSVVSTIENGTIQMEEDADIEEMSEQQDGNIEIQAAEMKDTTMADSDQSTTRKQQETTISRNTISTTAGDFTHQFNIQMKSTDTTNINSPTGVNRQ